MSIRLGDKVIGGVATNTISNAHNLLDSKPSDHIMNDMSWLRSDTFSWHSGNVYKAVYEKLVAEFNAGTVQTDIVSGIYLYPSVSPNGFKILNANDPNYNPEERVANVFNTTGAAWYYILDRTNKRFKLPRTSNHGTIVEKGQDGTIWYRVYADGWCEQGGIYTELNSEKVDNYKNRITWKKPFANTNYTVTGMGLSNDDTNYYKDSVSERTVVSRTNASIEITHESDVTKFNIIAKGYVNNVPEDSQHKYLYFYVGNYSKPAIEQTAGMNSEMFNDKVDISSLVECKTIIDSYVNPNADGTTAANQKGYEIYSDGTVVQYGYLLSSQNNNTVVTFLIPYKNSNYDAFVCVDSAEGYGFATSKTSTTFNPGVNGGNKKRSWITIGKGA